MIKLELALYWVAPHKQLGLKNGIIMGLALLYTCSLAAALVAPVRAQSWSFSSYEVWISLGAIIIFTAAVSAGVVYLCFRRKPGAHTEAVYRSPPGPTSSPMVVRKGWFDDAVQSTDLEERGDVGGRIERARRSEDAESDGPERHQDQDPVPSKAHDSPKVAMRGDMAHRNGAEDDREHEQENDSSDLFERPISTDELRIWQLERSSVQIVSQLGQGTHGAVFKAHHQTAQSTGIAKFSAVVFVETLDNNSEQSREDFQQDARVLMRLSHENIVRLIGVNFKSEPWRIVTEVRPAYSAPPYPARSLRMSLRCYKHLLFAQTVLFLCRYLQHQPC